MIIRHCAPTLAGIKTGSMVNCTLAEAQEWVGEMEPALSRLGLGLEMLWQRGGRALLYIYRPAMLEADLRKAGVAEFLEPHGYGLPVNRCIARLRRRFEEGPGFPHEVGLFLGYPLEDVQGFVRHGGKGYKCSGNWKVYGDAQVAQHMFARFHACTRNFLRRYQGGIGLEKLIAVKG